MNKRLTALVMALAVPLTFSANAADRTGTDQSHIKNTPVGKNGTAPAVFPVDLDAVSAKENTVPQPAAKVEADTLYVRNPDGYMQGRGNVDVTRGTDEIHTGFITGNSKTQVYETKGPTIYISDDQVVTADGVIYDAAHGTASVDKVDGYALNVNSALYFRGEGAKLADGSVYMKHGLITTPHAVAKTPDYYITADDIHIYPGEKYTAENTKLWFKHVLILTYGHYEGTLDKEESTHPWFFSLLPRPSFNSKDGFGVKGDAQFPLSADKSVQLNAEYRISTKRGFKPTLTVVKYSPFGRFSFGYSKSVSSVTDNDDYIWVTKWPELTYNTPSFRLGSTGLTMNGSASYGKWEESGVGKGTHKGISVSISHDPIRLWKGAALHLYAGYRKDWYEIGHNIRKDPYWGAVLKQQISDRFWTSIWYKQHHISGATPYGFDSIGYPHQAGILFGYAVSPRDAFIFSLSRETDNNHIDYRNYTWVRDLHSFIATITYKQVQKQWEIKVTAKDFE